MSPALSEVLNKDSTIYRRRESQLSWEEIRPYPVNDIIYGQVAEDDDFFELVRSIKAKGLLDPIHVTSDHFIISGHRRHKAMAHAFGGMFLTVHVVIYEDVEGGSTEHRILLRDANLQRVKTVEMMIRESAIAVNPEVAHKELRRQRHLERQRRESGNPVEKMEWDSRKKARSQFSWESADLVKNIQEVFEENREHWPLTVRQVHYRLLNKEFMKNLKTKTPYINDDKSYKATIRACLRMRIFRMIPWEAVIDETRTVDHESVWSNVGPFVKASVEQIFKFYARDLLQSQSDYVVMLAEKLTVRSILFKVCAEYTVPLMICRGYADNGSIYRLAQRFEDSGKERLVLLCVSDCDPEGENIPNAVKSAMVGDLGLDSRRIELRKVALTLDQARAFGLPPQPIKEEKEEGGKKSKGSSRAKKYMEKKKTKDVWEVEALTPGQLTTIATDAIESTINMEAFKRELEAERAEAASLEEKAELVRHLLGNRLT
jgi:hypothetical protein